MRVTGMKARAFAVRALVLFGLVGLPLIVLLAPPAHAADTALSTIVASIDSPMGLAITNGGTSMYVSSYGHDTVYSVTTSGAVSTAGSMKRPTYPAVDNGNNWYVGGTGDLTEAVSPSVPEGADGYRWGKIYANGTAIGGIKLDPSLPEAERRDPYYCQSEIVAPDINGNKCSTVANPENYFRFRTPQAVAADGGGSVLYVLDRGRDGLGGTNSYGGVYRVDLGSSLVTPIPVPGGLSFSGCDCWSGSANMTLLANNTLLISVNGAIYTVDVSSGNKGGIANTPTGGRWYYANAGSPNDWKNLPSDGGFAIDPSQSFVALSSPASPESSACVGSLYRHSLAGGEQPVKITADQAGGHADGTPGTVCHPYGIAMTAVGAPAGSFWAYVADADPVSGSGKIRRVEVRKPTAREIMDAHSAENLGVDSAWLDFAGDPVNAANGNLVHQTTDIDFPGSVYGMNFQRTLNTRDTTPTLSPLQSAWSTSFSVKLSLLGSATSKSNIGIRMNDGRQVAFINTGTNQWTSPEGIDGTLTFNGTTSKYELLFRSQEKWIFGSDGRLSSMQNWDGQTVTLAYDTVAPNLLKTATSSTGHILTFVWQANNWLASVTASTNQTGKTDGRVVSYHYNLSDNAANQPGDYCHLRVDFGDGGRDCYVYNGNPGQVGDIYEGSRVDGTLHKTLHVDYESRGLRVSHQFIAHKNDTSGDNVYFTYQDTSGAGTDQADTIVKWGDAASPPVIAEQMTYMVDTGSHARGAIDPYGKTTNKTWTTNGKLGTTSDRQSPQATTTNGWTGTQLNDVTRPLTTAGAKSTSLNYVGASDDRPQSATQRSGPTQTLSTSFGYNNPSDPKDKIPHTVTEPGQTAATVVDSANGLVTKTVDPDGVSTKYTYDPVTRDLLTNVQGFGSTTPQTTQMVYDGAGRMLTSTSQMGAITRFTYDARSRLLSQTDSDADNVTYFPLRNRYDTVGNLARVYGRDNPSNPDAPDSATNRPTSRSTYTSDHQLLTQTAYVNLADTTGATTTYDYDSAGRQTTVTAPGNAVTTMAYGALGRLTQKVVPGATAGGVSTWYHYDNNGNTTWTIIGPTDVANPDAVGADLSHATHRVYDARNRLTEVDGPTGDVERDGTTSARSVTKYVYDELDRKTDVTEGFGSPRQVTTHTDYDASGREWKTTVIRQNTDTSLITEKLYTPAGRLQSSTEEPVNLPQARPSGEPGAVGYNWATGDQSLKRVTSYVYDALGREWKVTPPNFFQNWPRVTTYDGDGRAIRIDEPRSNGDATAPYKRMDYDQEGRVLRTFKPNPARAQTSDPAEVVQTTAYDPEGRTLRTTEAHVPPTSYATDPYPAVVNTYDWRGSVKTVTNANGTAQDLVSYTYDGRANRQTRTAWTNNDPANPTSFHQATESWDWFGDNQLKSQTDPINTALSTGAKRTTYDYDLYGRVKTITQPSGRTENRQYWNSGGVKEADFAPTAAGTATVTVKHWFDARGAETRVTAVQSGQTLTSDYTYNDQGNITSATVPTPGTGASGTYSYYYDMAGNPFEITYPDTAQFQYQHDRQSRLTMTAANVGGGYAAVAMYSYDGDGNMTSEDLGNGQARTYTYDNTLGHTGEAKTYHQVIHNASPNPDTVTNTTALWRPDGRLKLETDTLAGITKNYQYDNAGQVSCQSIAGGCQSNTATCTATTTTEFRYTYNTRGSRLCSANGDGTTTNYSYDDNARLTGSVNSTSGATTYHSDDDGRRDSQTAAGVTIATNYDDRGLPNTKTKTQSGTTSTIESRTYDGHQQMTRLVTPNTAYDLVWDETRPVPQILDGWANGTNYVRSNYGLERINYRTGPYTAYMYSYDMHDSVIATPSALAPSNGYDPFGAPAPGSAATFDTYMGYKGEQTINDLVYLRARDYDPKTGSFTKRDPLDGVPGTTTQANPYHYVNNDPLNGTDPTGLRCTDGNCYGPPPPPPPLACAGQPGYETGRMNDYMRGTKGAPCAFESVMSYVPEPGVAGDLSIARAPGSYGVFNRFSDGCSAEILTFASTVPFSSVLINPYMVTRAYEAFDQPCRSHDYAYDLVRFARRTKAASDIDLKRDRSDADAALHTFSNKVCAQQGFIFSTFPAVSCIAIGDLMNLGLHVWTQIQGADL